MSELDDLAALLPIDQLAAQVGADPAEVQNAVGAVLPALLAGMSANAADPAGEASLAAALAQHSTDLTDGGIDLSQVDQADGAKIAAHIFGANTDQVIAQLGGTGGASSGLISKLLPILAPIVLSYLAKRMGASGGGAAGAGVLGSILQQILTGAAQGSAPSGSASANPLDSILGDVLGGLLGGGRR